MLVSFKTSHAHKLNSRLARFRPYILRSFIGSDIYEKFHAEFNKIKRRERKKKRGLRNAEVLGFKLSCPFFDTNKPNFVHRSRLKF